MTKETDERKTLIEFEKDVMLNEAHKPWATLFDHRN